MTEPAPHEADPSAPVPPPRRGFLLRLAGVAVAPALLLGLAGAWLARSLVDRAGEPLPVGYFLSAFLPTALLAAALGVLLAYAADFLLRGQLAVLVRALRTGRGGDARSLAVGRGWGGLTALAQEVQEAVSRAEDLVREDTELKALQASADDVLEKVREWAETETAPELAPEGPLAGLVSGLRLLADHLDDRAREARDAGALARESVGEACEGILRAGREGERAAREIATLRSALGEVRRLSGDLLDGLRQERERGVAAAQAAAVRIAALPAAAPAEPEAGAEAPEADAAVAHAQRWADAEARLRAVREQLRLIERRALRAALETAAAGLGGDDGTGERWWALVAEQKRTMAEAARASAAAAALEREIGAARDAELAALAEAAERRRAAVAAGRAAAASAAAAAGALASLPAPEPLPERLVALADRLHQWARDAIARAERLATIAEGATAQTDAALSAARAGADELGGLLARFESRPAPAAPLAEVPAAEPDEAPPPEPGSPDDGAPAELRAAWPSGSRPLRLLTRADVLPEEESGG